MISRITNATGNAAMMDTLCRFAMELSENTSAIGSRISMIAQKAFTALWGYSSPVIWR